MHEQRDSIYIYLKKSCLKENRLNVKGEIRQALDSILQHLKVQMTQATHVFA